MRRQCTGPGDPAGCSGGSKTVNTFQFLRSDWHLKLGFMPSPLPMEKTHSTFLSSKCIIGGGGLSKEHIFLGNPSVKNHVKS